MQSCAETSVAVERGWLASGIRTRATATGLLLVAPGGRTVHLDPATLHTLDAWAGARDATDVAVPSVVPTAVAELRELGFLDGAPPSVPATARRFAVTHTGLEADLLAPIAARVAVIVRHLPTAVLGRVAAATAVCATAAWGVHVAGSGTSTTEVIDRYGAVSTWLIVASVGLAAAVAHELAHAVVASHFGARVGRAGIGPYWGGLSWYVDTTEVLLLPRRARLLQGVAGPVCDGLVTAGFVVAASVDGDRAALWWRLASITALAVVLNLVPLLTLDGYWLLADLVDDPQLHERSQVALVARRRTRSSAADRRLVVYGALSLLFGLVLLALSVVLWWSMLGTLATDLWARGGWRRTIALWIAGTGALTIGASLLTAVIPTVTACVSRPSSVEP